MQWQVRLNAIIIITIIITMSWYVGIEISILKDKEICSCLIKLNW